MTCPTADLFVLVKSQVLLVSLQTLVTGEPVQSEVTIEVPFPKMVSNMTELYPTVHSVSHLTENDTVQSPDGSANN